MTFPSHLNYKRIALIIVMCVPNDIDALIPSSFADPAPPFHIRGINPSLTFCRHDEKDDAPLAALNITPYRHFVTNALNKNGNDVPIGDRLGRWSMAGMLWKAKDVHGSSPTENPRGFAKAWANLFPTLYSTVAPVGAAAGQVSLIIDNDENQTDVIDWSKQERGFYSVKPQFERLGLRGEICLELIENIKLNIQGGVCEYNFTPTFLNPITGVCYDEVTSVISDPIDGRLMLSAARTAIAREIGLNISSYRQLVAEDASAQLSICYPFKYKDKAGDVVLNLSPRITGGLIAPVSKKENLDIAFSLPVGNDDTLGGMIECALDLDFKETILANIACGYTLFDESNRKGYRVPSNIRESVLYPHKRDVHIERGGTWHLNASLQAQNFIEGLKAYIDYTWIVHRPDRFSFTDSTAFAARLAAVQSVTINGIVFTPLTVAEIAETNDGFAYGLEKLRTDSSWQATLLHGGLSYQLANNLEAGVSMQATFSGRNVFENTTLMGSVSFLF